MKDGPAVRLLDGQGVAPEHCTPPADKRVAGNPRQTLWTEYADPSGKFFAGTWASEVGAWRVHYTEEEECRILEGVSIITDADGRAVTVRAGDRFVIPRGFVGSWEVVEPTRKTFVVYEPGEPSQTPAPSTSDRDLAPGTTSLRPMSAGEFATWRPDSLRRYAAEKVRSGDWDEASSLDRADAELARLLPEGTATPNHHLFTVQDADGQSVGMLWFARMERGGVPVGYVYELAIWPAFRRLGHAQRAMRALEERARAMGCEGLALHVFGHNAGARQLYAALGYTETNVNMHKSLRD